MAIRKEEEKKNNMKITDNMDGEKRADDKLNMRKADVFNMRDYLKYKDAIQNDKDLKEIGFKKKVNELGYNKTFCTTTTDSIKISSTASKWIKKYNSKKPFFISIGYFDTHREYVKKISENFI